MVIYLYRYIHIYIHIYIWLCYIQTGYEPSIVFSNGRADDMHPVDSLSTGHRYNISDILVFDVNVLKTNPKILNDYSTPHILSHFGSDIDRDSVSPVLSIGGLNLGHLDIHLFNMTKKE